MAAFIFVIGVFNFVLGYFLALALADPPFGGLLSLEIWRSVWKGILAGGKPLKAMDLEDGFASEGAEEEATGPTLPPIAPLSELPELWQHELHDDGLQLNTLASGVAHFLRLEGTVYREHLLTAEARAAQAIAIPEPPVLEQLAADLRFINIDWTRKLRQAASLLEERTGRLGPGEEPALQLAELLRDQGGQIAELDREVHGLNFRSEGSTAARRLLAAMQNLIGVSHWLRDENQRFLAAICQCEGTLAQVDRKLHYDPATGLLGRLGVEGLFAGDFKPGVRPAVAMQISLDRFGKVNQRLGARAGDQAIKALAAYLAELAVAKCEKSLLARQAGVDFLLFAHETTQEELIAVGEHIRQSFEAASLNYQGTDFNLTLTISVAAVSADADLSAVLHRLHAVRDVAINAGQNRTACWDNGSATLTLPPAIPVAAKTIVVAASAA